MEDAGDSLGRTEEEGSALQAKASEAGGKALELDRPEKAAANTTDAGRITTQLGTPRGRYDEHSRKSSLSKKPRFIELVGKS
jgi:hypothetical protein